MVRLNSALLLAVICLARTCSAQVCRAPFSLLLTARNQWGGRIGASNTFQGLSVGVNDTRFLPATPVDRIQNLTIYLNRAVYVIGFSVATVQFPGHGFIASASYNGQLIPGLSTGSLGSDWWYTTAPPSTGWDTQIQFSMRNWSRADPSVRCQSSTVPTENIDGNNYVNVISGNGANPGNVPSFWIGSSPNCTLPESRVYYRAVVNLTHLFPEPACVPPSDTRTLLGTHMPIVGFTVGKKSSETKELTILGTADNEFDAYVGGRIGTGEPDLPGVVGPVVWARIQAMTYHVRPTCQGKLLIAFHVRNSEDMYYRGFIAALLLDGIGLDVTGSDSNWLAAPAATFPAKGWNTDLDFNTTAFNWTTPHLAETNCVNTWGSRFHLYLNGTTGGMTPKWIWSEDCRGRTSAKEAYLRLVVNLPGASAASCITTTSTSTSTSTTTTSTSTTSTTSTTTTTALTTAIMTTSIPFVAATVAAVESPPLMMSTHASEKQSLVVSMHSTAKNQASTFWPEVTLVGKPGGEGSVTTNPSGSVGEMMLVIAVAGGTGFGIVLLGLLAFLIIRRTFGGKRAPQNSVNIMTSNANLTAANRMASNATLPAAIHSRNNMMASNASLRMGGAPPSMARQGSSIPIKYTTPMRGSARLGQQLPTYANASRPTLIESTVYMERTQPARQNPRPSEDW